MIGKPSSTGHFDWMRPYSTAVVICLIVFTVSRIGLIAWMSARVADTNGYYYILVQGLRFDLVTLGTLLGIPMAITPLINSVESIRNVWLNVVRYYLVAVIGCVTFMELSTPSFIAEYDVRPNFLFVEYLKYPQEVFSMLFAEYKVDFVAAIVIVPIVLGSAVLLLRRSTANIRQSNAWSALPISILTLFICFAAVRSTLDHRPVNPSTVAFSSDTLVNSLPLNSLYTVGYAVYELRYEDSGFPYGEVGDQPSLGAAQSAMRIDPELFIAGDIPTLHYQHATYEFSRPKNLVIVVEESLGAEFVGSLGGLPLTPNLDALSKVGIWFEQLYATGTRSARGLEAIVAGFPPTTSQSVLKLGKAQRDFFTLGQLLAAHGFDTSFIYGGESQFDNMKRFFASNGFETIIDKNDFENPVFRGSWGVSDEDIFNLAHREFSSKPDGRPFFSLVFTTSNHSPWEFPDGRITLYDQPKATRNNSVKYADHALGEFIKKASQSEYWDDTVFLIVADHNSRVYGADLVPIERFRIPGLILGGVIPPQTVDRRASQIDLLPTLLSLIGISSSHPAIGVDLTRADVTSLPERAIMQYGDTQAYWENDLVAVLRKNRPAEVFRYENGEYIGPIDRPELAAKAQALAEWPVRTYRNRRYRIPSEKTLISDEGQ